MNDDQKTRLDETVMDWALDERVGGQRPPDLRDAVHQRLAASHLTPIVPSARGKLVVAAAILFGTLVVFAVAWSRFEVGRQDEAGSAAQEPQQPTRVSSRAEIEALPDDTQHVIGIGIEDDEVPALLRLRHLEVLCLEAVYPSPFKPGEPVRPLNTLTDEGLKRLASMKQLRVLRLVNQFDIGAAGLAMLQHLPALEELSMQACMADDGAFAVLDKMPRLAVLRLSGCSRIGAPTIERIAAIESLRGLSLAACGQLQQEWLTPLARLEHLESLDLGMIGSRTWFSGFSAVELPEPGTGVTDVVLSAVGRMRSLRHLDISYAGITGAGLQELLVLPLESLDLTCIEVPPADLLRLPPTLVKLTMRGTTVSYPDLGGTLAEATPRLAELILDHSPGIGDAQLGSLAALAHLRRLDVSYCQNVTAAGLAQLGKLPALEELTMRGSFAFFGDAGTRLIVQAMPKLRRFVTDKNPSGVR